MSGAPDPVKGGRGQGGESALQPSLFDVEPARVLLVAPPPLFQAPPLTADAPLSATRLPYQQYLQRTDRTRNTVTCFLSDLRLFVAGLGADRPVRSITFDDLDTWLKDMRRLPGTRRLASSAPEDVTPRPKTMERRRTFLKNYFGWLVQEGVLERDPAAQVLLKRPRSLPYDLLHEDEVQRLEAAASEEIRCQVLVKLLLEAGLKKEEVMGLRQRHVDLSDAAHPAIEIRFPHRALHWRERRIALSAEWGALYQRYLERYRPADQVFECTGRNLNYILSGAARRAGLQKEVNPQRLRDVFAVRLLRGGVASETVRTRLGLSEEAWYESYDKYRKMAFAV
jgi:integrase/recombinase XerD